LLQLEHMGRKKKPEDSATEPEQPPPVAPRPGAADSSFEQEKASKKVDKKLKKDGAQTRTRARERESAADAEAPAPAAPPALAPAHTAHTACTVVDCCGACSQEGQEW
jgi:hypothetical protein